MSSCDPLNRLFVLSPNDNLLGRVSALQLLNALDDLLPADSVYNLVLDRLQSAGSKVGLKSRDPARNVLGHSCTDRLVKAVEMAKFSAVLLDRGRGVEWGPVDEVSDTLS